MRELTVPSVGVRAAVMTPVTTSCCSRVASALRASPRWVLGALHGTPAPPVRHGVQHS
jgi:hypothetical protein